jgi:thiol:disulfide interchange protein DsbD
VAGIWISGLYKLLFPKSISEKVKTPISIIGTLVLSILLVLFAFPSTGPIIGVLLIQSTQEGPMAPYIGLFGFALGLTIPFSLIIIFANTIKNKVQNKSWTGSIKIVLGFLLFGFALKYLSNADLIVQAEIFTRNVFLALWVLNYGLLALFLFRFLKVDTRDTKKRLPISNIILGIFTVVFVIYLIPGFWGAPLKLVNGFPPPIEYGASVDNTLTED